MQLQLRTFVQFAYAEHLMDAANKGSASKDKALQALDRYFELVELEIKERYAKRVR